MATTFYDRFAANMALLHLPAPRSLFETATTTVATIGLIARTIKEYGPRVTVGEVFGTLPTITGVAVGGAVVAELSGVVGSLLATAYLGAVIGSLLVATGQTLGIDRFLVVADEHRVPGLWLMPAFTETAARMIAAREGRR